MFSKGENLQSYPTCCRNYPPPEVYRGHTVLLGAQFQGHEWERQLSFDSSQRSTAKCAAVASVAPTEETRSAEFYPGGFPTCRSIGTLVVEKTPLRSKSIHQKKVTMTITRLYSSLLLKVGAVTKEISSGRSCIKIFATVWSWRKLTNSDENVAYSATVPHIEKAVSAWRYSSIRAMDVLIKNNSILIKRN